jgi:hypothetical protein
MLHKKIFEKKNIEVGKNIFYNEQKQVKKSSRLIKQSNVIVNFIRCVICFTKRFRK